MFGEWDIASREGWFAELPDIFERVRRLHTLPNVGKFGEG
jgi:hypothetical protein